ncbi:MAG: hypothetical protein AB7T48_05175 [Solirubrobacterales bacterium]
MKHIRRRLTYSNVVASLALFLVVAGGSAFAANQLAKNSVGSKQIKKNAVTAAKIKKNAVTSAKIKNAAITTAKIKGAAVTGAQIADGSITGAEINPTSTPFTRLVGTVNRTAVAAATPPAPYLIGTYTQPVGEVDSFVSSVTVSFADSCKAPRTFQAYLLIDPANPAAPSAFDLAGVTVFEDKAGGALTKQLSFTSGLGGYAPTTYAAPAVATQRVFYVLPLGATCSSGSGVNIQSAKINVLGTPGG